MVNETSSSHLNINDRRSFIQDRSCQWNLRELKIVIISFFCRWKANENVIRTRKNISDKKWRVDWGLGQGSLKGKKVFSERVWKHYETNKSKLLKLHFGWVCKSSFNKSLKKLISEKSFKFSFNKSFEKSSFYNNFEKSSFYKSF